MDTSEYLGLFLDESRESLQALSASLLDLEREPSDPGPLAVVFRIAHSLKGMSATMGFDAMARLTHRMEEVLAVMRDDGAPVTPAVSDALFACLDALQEMVDRIAAGDPAELDASWVLGRLDAVAGADAASPAAAEVAATLAPPAGPGSYDCTIAAQADGRGPAVMRVAVRFDEDCRLMAACAAMVVRELEALGEVVASDPPPEAVENGDVGPEGVAWWVVTGAAAEALRSAVLGVSEVASCEVEAVLPGDGTAAQGSAVPPVEGRAASQAPAGERRPARAAPSTVRVGTDRLDALVNLMGEMVVQRTRLVRLAQRHRLADLRVAVEDTSRVIDDLRALIMQLRMTPVDAVFMRFPRMVRDLANSLGKRVELIVTGEATELERTIIDGLGDPLLHMLRNAVDHGLEGPAEREAAGKDPVGRVHLSARRVGDHVVIEVRDDGRGIDPDALRASAVRKGLMDAAAAAALSDEQALDLAFLAGVSSAARTTDVSGRGVGMDAVRSAIAELDGDVSISSAIGRGSTFTVRIPLTLAITRALLVTVGGDGASGHPRLCAIPLEAVEETVVVAGVEVRPVGGRPCLALGDRVVPLVRLRERLGLQGDRPGAAERLDVVVVSVGTVRLGLVVDGLVGRQDIVVEHLPGSLGEVPGLAGATILGDGAIALIVDVESVAAAAGLLP